MTKCDKNKLSTLRQSLLNAKYNDVDEDPTCHDSHTITEATSNAPRHSLQGPPNLKTAVRAGIHTYVHTCMYPWRCSKP